MPITAIEQNPLLFGHDSRSCIIAVEPAGAFIRLFFRTAGHVHFEDEPFLPFILVNDPEIVSGCKVSCSVQKLLGNDYYSCCLRFDSWNDCLTARDFLALKTGKPYSSPAAPYLFLPDLSHQYMLATGVTLFKGLDFSELHCLALDIETDCAKGYSFSNAARAEDRIISIALKDSRNEEIILKGSELSEPQMLTALNAAIKRIDPDIITGHNIFRFDLDYISQRARMHNIVLNWGRNASTPHITPHSRWNLAEKTVEYPRWDIYGRQVVDTWFLTELYDIAGRNLTGHGLKEVAKYFGVAADNRTYLEGSDISGKFKNEPDQLYKYNLDDARETLSLFNILAYPWFLQSRIFPYSFQNCIIRGNATRINSLFLREYLHLGHSIPSRTDETVTFEGGYTESAISGVISHVVHCDVASLYPSLMLAYQLAPPKDSLHLFLPMLAELRNFRLLAKQLAKDAKSENEKLHFDALQQIFKILINSFYGYLGATRHNFSDPSVAAEITRLGRVTIKNMIDSLSAEGATIIEVDTDGIYFKPPDGCNSEAEERELIIRISAALPDGIEVELDGRYRAMFSYKAKNYALMPYSGDIIIKGSGLRSRSEKPYLLEFTRDIIKNLLSGKGEQINSLYEEYCVRLRSKNLDVKWVAKTENLGESPVTYKEKVKNGERNRSAAFEIAIKSNLQYKSGDQISFYVTGSVKGTTAYDNCRPVADFDPEHPDINVNYYIEKLYQTKKRFEAFLPKEPTLFDL